MTQQLSKVEFIVNTTNVDSQNEAIAAAIEFDYLPMVGQFYNTIGQPVSDFNVGYLAYFAGFKFNELTSNEMALGWEDAHGEMSFAQGLDSYRNEPGFAESERWF